MLGLYGQAVKNHDSRTLHPNRRVPYKTVSFYPPARNAMKRCLLVQVHVLTLMLLVAICTIRNGAKKLKNE